MAMAMAMVIAMAIAVAYAGSCIQLFGRSWLRTRDRNVGWAVAMLVCAGHVIEAICTSGCYPRVIQGGNPLLTVKIGPSTITTSGPCHVFYGQARKKKLGGKDSQEEET